MYVFVVLNKGIVIGDRSNHVPILHVPQLFYYLAFSAFFLMNYVTLEFIKKLLKVIFSMKGLAIVSLCVGVLYLLIQRYTYAHPYLLADNRHYTFYIWKKHI